MNRIDWSDPDNVDNNGRRVEKWETAEDSSVKVRVAKLKF